MHTPLINDRERSFIGCLLGVGIGCSISAIIYVPSGMSYWVSLMLTSGATGLVGGMVGLSSIGGGLARLIAGPNPRPKVPQTLQELGGEALGMVERLAIPSLLLQLTEAAKGAGPEVARAAARVQDAGQQLAHRLTREPHLHVEARKAFAHHIPAAIDLLIALRDIKQEKRGADEAVIIEQLTIVVTAIENNNEKLSNTASAKLDAAFDKLAATLDTAVSGLDKTPARKRGGFGKQPKT